MDITKLDIKELKALAYDEIGKLELAKSNLEVLNREINSRSNDGKIDGNEVQENN